MHFKNQIFWLVAVLESKEPKNIPKGLRGLVLFLPEVGLGQCKHGRGELVENKMDHN